jgi:polar amino acid transport system substrate-binding protein
MSLFAMPAYADKLQDIVSAGVVRIGVSQDTVPFGYIDADGKPAGIDVEIAQKIAEALGVRLEMQQVTGSNRVSFLLTDRIDILIANLGMSPARALQVQFTAPYVNGLFGVFGPKDVPVSSVGELGSYKVALVMGGAAAPIILAEKPDANLLRADSDSIAATAYLSGQADLYATGNIVAAAVAAQNPQKEFELKFVLRYSPSHMAVQMDQHNLVNWLNSFIYYSMLNGDLQGIWKKYLGDSVVPLTLPLPSL